jgi:AcrR family transcriptional regulator
MTETVLSAALDQRPRLIAAFTKATGEHGFAHVDVDVVVRYAGLDAADFYGEFAGMEQALLAAQKAYLGRLWLDIEGACERAEAWPEKIRDSVTAVTESLVETSAVARVFAIEAPGASLAAAERQFVALDRLAARLRRGRRFYPCAADLPESTERALLGGTVSIVCEHLLAEDPQAIPRLRCQLIELLLSPYVGDEEARRLAAEPPLG